MFRSLQRDATVCFGTEIIVEGLISKYHVEAFSALHRKCGNRNTLTVRWMDGCTLQGNVRTLLIILSVTHSTQAKNEAKCEAEPSTYCWDRCKLLKQCYLRSETSFTHSHLPLHKDLFPVSLALANLPLSVCHSLLLFILV